MTTGDTTPTDRPTDRPINWEVSEAEADLIRQIAARAVRLLGAPAHSSGDPQRMYEMTVTAVHANGCPLRLDVLLTTDASTFAHDVNGMEHHVDRKTGELRDFFVPRTAAADAPSYHHP